MPAIDNKEKMEEGKQEEIDAFFVIGGFLLIFGLAILAAVFFTPTFHGRITNLISSIVLLGIGLGGILKSQHFSKSKK